MKIATKIPLSPLGRRKNSIKKYSSKEWPIEKLKIGNSFVAYPIYDYGKALAIKNTCRKRADKLDKTNWRFSVREHGGKIRVWRVQ